MFTLKPKEMKCIRVLRPTIVVIIFLWSSFSYSQTQKSFKEMGANTPNYKIIQRVIRSNKLKLKPFYGKRWGPGKYGGAWKRVNQYFPKKFYINSSSTNFMHHWFNPKGQMEMAVYQSKELKRAVKNYSTFNDGTIVRAYKRMRGQKNQTAAHDFKKKLGLLEKYFLSEKDRKLLKKYLKDEKSMTKGVKGIYQELLKELREEGDHMFAAALLHEGMHAKMDNDQKVAQIDRDFKSCKTPVQWDEFRGYMSEIEYHMNYYKWAIQNINAHWKRIESLLKDLEKFRGYKKPLSKSDLARIEKIKAKIKAHIAIIRVRLREIKQSLDRIKGLMDYFKKNYVKKGTEKEYKNYKAVKDMIDGVGKKVNDFADAAQKAIDAKEKVLKDLEDILKKWNVWAACTIPEPPTKEKHKNVVKKFKGTPTPSTPSTEAEKKEAEKNIVKSSGRARRSIAGPSTQKPESKYDSTTVKKEKIRTNDSLQDGMHKDKKINISSGIDISNFKLDALNNYLSYLNDTWNGNISQIGTETGYWANASFSINDNMAIGAEYTYFSNTTTGFLTLTGANYRSEHTLRSLELVTTYNIPFASTGLGLDIKGGIGSYWSEYIETENTFVAKGNSTTLGYKLSGGLNYSPTSWLEFIAYFGYRNAIFKDFSNAVEFFQPQDTNVELDLSGTYSQIGIKVRL